MMNATQLANVDVTPVLVVSNFFTGRTPASAARTDALLVAVAEQETYYKSVGSSDPELAGYEALGRGFAKAFPGPTLLDYADDWFIVNTYANAFGYDATADQVAHFLKQEAYYLDLFGNAGLSGNDLLAQARGVVIGQILGWAVRTDGTPLNEAAGHAASAYLRSDFVYGNNIEDYEPEPEIVEVPVEVIVEVEVPVEVIVEVPVPGPVVDKPDVIAQSFGTIDALHKNATGGLLFGDGTTAAQGLQTVVDPTSGWTIASGTSPRQSVEGNYRPDKVSFDGVTLTVEHKIPSGSQDDANGSQADNAARGANSLSFTFGNSKATLSDLIAAGNKLVYGIDQDPTAGAARLELTAFTATDGSIDFKDASGLIAITDSEGNANTVANSQQQNFYLPGGVADLVSGAQFSNSLEVFDSAGVKLVGIVENWTLGAAGFSPNDQLV